MRVFSRKTILDYGLANAQAREELQVWFLKMEAANWTNFNELRADLPSTDYIGNDRYVFNIKGNRYRLLAMLFFNSQRLYIRGIFTHAEYTKLAKQNKLAAL